MNAATKLAAFGAVLVGTFAAAWGVGAAVDPIDEPAGSTTGTDHGGAAHEHGGDVASGAEVTGLSIAADGMRLVPSTDELGVATPAEYAFVVEWLDDSTPVTDFDVVHEREMHLIVASQDLAEFEHVHPTMAPDGTWSVDLAVPAPGAYRLYAEFQPAGRDDTTVLSAVAFAPGTPPTPPSLTEDRVAELDDGYELTLHGDLVAGTASTVEVEVELDGEPVTDLEPYLGAAGHLVALRAGDLAYAHVHPEGDLVSGPDVPFVVEVPSPGTYRLFLDFRHGGVVRTASFTVVAP